MSREEPDALDHSLKALKRKRPVEMSAEDVRRSLLENSWWPRPRPWRRGGKVEQDVKRASRLRSPVVDYLLLRGNDWKASIGRVLPAPGRTISHGSGDESNLLIPSSEWTENPGSSPRPGAVKQHG